MIRLRAGLFVSLWAALALIVTTPAHPRQMEPTASPREILVLTRLAPEHFRLDSGYGGGYGSAQAQSARRHVAQRIARHYGLKLVDDWPMPLIDLACFVMEVPDGQSVEEMAKQVSGDPRVSFAEPMHVYQTKGKPPVYNDPLFPAQPDATAWRLADLHQLSTGRGVTVAVIDSGVDSDHPDLAGQIMTRKNFVTGHAAIAEQHGTGVAGVIAAKAGNGAGIVGVAPGARLMALRACWQQEGSVATVCDTLSIAKALHFAIEKKAQVVNLSLAGPQDALLGQLLDVALARGSAIVAAFDSSLPVGGFPASKHGVIAVSDDQLAVEPPDVYTAPGKDVLTTQPGGRWYLVNGSSYAAAHVSGLVALLRAERPSNGHPPILVAARSNGGAIDACASLLRLSGPCNCACAKAPKIAENMRR